MKMADEIDMVPPLITLNLIGSRLPQADLLGNGVLRRIHRISILEEIDGGGTDQVLGHIGYT